MTTLATMTDPQSAGPSGPDGPDDHGPADAILAGLAALRAGEGDPVDDRALLDLRGGRLTGDAAEQVEARLLRSAAARGVWMAQAEAVSEGAMAEAVASLRAAARPALRPRPVWTTWQFWFGGVGLLGAAVAAALVLMASPPAVDLPAYDAELRGAVMAQRGADDPEGRRFVPTSQVTVLLKPATVVATPIAPQIFTGPAAGPLRPAPSDAITAGEGGVWRLRARADALFSQAGPQVVLTVFAAEPVDGAGRTARAIADAWEDRARLVLVPLDYDPQGAP